VVGSDLAGEGAEVDVDLFVAPALPGEGAVVVNGGLADAGGVLDVGDWAATVPSQDPVQWGRLESPPVAESNVGLSVRSALTSLTQFARKALSLRFLRSELTHQRRHRRHVTERLQFAPAAVNSPSPG